MTQVPKKQMAQVFDRHGGPIQFREIDVPRIASDEVLVNIRYTGVCHTDLHAWKGDWPPKAKLPLVGGHEGAGVVVAVGDQVKDITIGDHVGVKWINGTCLSCTYCTTGDEPLCQKATMSGLTVDGSFQQYCAAKAAHVARIPKEIPLDAISPILCAGITVYKGLKETRARPGETVAIVGAGGGLGSLALQYARAMGLRSIAIDTGEKKRDMCKALGAGAFLDFVAAGDDLPNLVREASGGDKLGPHAVLLLSPYEKPLQHAVEYMRPRGVVCSIGLPGGNAHVRALNWDLVVKMIDIKGSYVGTRADTAEAIDFFARGLIKAPFKTVGLSELPKVFEAMEKGQIAGRYVLDTSK